MSILDKVVTGKIKKPVFMCIYGTSGIGKTTFAASAPKPLFLATEEGTNELDVSRLQASSWIEMKESLSELAHTPTDYQTIVVDSLDHLEALIFKQVAEDKEKESIEDIGYAKGYIYALDYWKQFLNLVKNIRDNQGKHIILISHVHVKTFTDPQHNESYDRYELKMHRKASDLIKETVDMLLFATKDVAFKKDQGSNKAKVFDMDGRLLYTELEAAFDAKNRFGLPPKMELLANKGFNVLLEAIDKSHGETAESLYRQVSSLIKMIDDQTTAKKAQEFADKNKQSVPELRATMERLKTLVKE